MNTPKMIGEIHALVNKIYDKLNEKKEPADRSLKASVVYIEEQLDEISKFMEIAAYKKEKRREILKKAREKRNKDKKE